MAYGPAETPPARAVNSTRAPRQLELDESRGAASRCSSSRSRDALERGGQLGAAAGLELAVEPQRQHALQPRADLRTLGDPGARAGRGR